MFSQILRASLLVAVISVLGGCAASGPINVTDNPVGNKTGQACVTNVLGLFASGDASIEAAKKDGGIDKVATVDVVAKSGLFKGKYCTIVTGT